VAFGLFCAGSSSGQQLARDFFDNTVIHEIRIDLDPNDWAALKRDYLANTYYHAGVSSGLQSASDVGIRSRGNGSRSPEKPNLDVNIGKYVKKQIIDLDFSPQGQQPDLLDARALPLSSFCKMGYWRCVRPRRGSMSTGISAHTIVDMWTRTQHCNLGERR
jgi:spore coat protein CotH